MALIFISHSKADAPFARAFADQLRERGHTVAGDVDDRVAGNLYESLLEDLSKADCVVLLLTEKFKGSAWSASEGWAARALQRVSLSKRPRIIPLLFDGGEPPRTLTDLYYYKVPVDPLAAVAKVDELIGNVPHGSDITLPSFQPFERGLDRFRKDHPDFEKSVFIAMRFRGTEQFKGIEKILRDTVAKYGLKALRADDKTYSDQSDLWENVCIYMLGCKYAICVIESIEESQFNPNVAIEYGFLRALDRGILVLKEKQVRVLPADMLGKLYREFDGYKLKKSIAEQVSEWAVRDLGL